MDKKYNILIINYSMENSPSLFFSQIYLIKIYQLWIKLVHTIIIIIAWKISMFTFSQISLIQNSQNHQLWIKKNYTILIINYSLKFLCL